MLQARERFFGKNSEKLDQIQDFFEGGGDRILKKNLKILCPFVKKQSMF